MSTRTYQYSPRAIADLLAAEGITDCDVDHAPIEAHGFLLTPPLVIKNPGRADLYLYLQYDRELGTEYFEIWTLTQGLIVNDFRSSRLFNLLKAILPK